jgi:hypothetical protein
MPFGGDQPVGIGAIALSHTVRVFSGKEVRISARKRHRSEGLTSGSSPLAMPLLLFLVRLIDEGGEGLDHHVVAAEAKGCRLHRYARGGAFELMRKDGAVGRGGGLHRFDKNIDGGAVDRGQPARVHEQTLPIDDIRVVQGQRSSIGHGFEVAGEQVF